MCIFTFKAEKDIPMRACNLIILSVLRSTLNCFCYCLQDNISGAVLS